jgi:mycothiol system anti-sigma-R factor
MGCKRIRRVVFLWVDRDREAAVREPMGRHLDECPHCRRRAHEIERVVMIVRRSCSPCPAPSSLSERIRTLLDVDPTSDSN